MSSQKTVALSIAGTRARLAGGLCGKCFPACTPGSWACCSYLGPKLSELTRPLLPEPRADCCGGVHATTGRSTGGWVPLSAGHPRHLEEQAILEQPRSTARPRKCISVDMLLILLQGPLQCLGGLSHAPAQLNCRQWSPDKLPETQCAWTGRVSSEAEVVPLQSLGEASLPWLPMAVKIPGVCIAPVPASAWPRLFLSWPSPSNYGSTFLDLEPIG